MPTLSVIHAVRSRFTVDEDKQVNKCNYLTIINYVNKLRIEKLGLRRFI